MTEPHLIDRARQLVVTLDRLAQDRARAQRNLDATFEQALENASGARDSALHANETRYQERRDATESAYSSARDRTSAWYEAESAEADASLQKARRSASAQFAKMKDTLETEHQEATWTANAHYEGKNVKAEAQRIESLRKLAAHRERIESIRSNSLEMLGAALAPFEAAHPEGSPESLSHQLRASLDEADATFAELQTIPRSHVLSLLRPSLRGKRSDLAARLASALRDAEQLCHAGLTQLETNYAAQLAKEKDRHDCGQRAIEERFRRDLDAIARERDDAIAAADRAYEDRMAAATRRRDLETSATEQDYARETQERERDFPAQAAAIDADYQTACRAASGARQRAWDEMAAAWRSGLAAIQYEADSIRSAMAAHSPDWNSRDGWQAAANLPPAIRFGSLAIDRDRVLEGVPSEPELDTAGPRTFSLAALLPFPRSASLYVHPANCPPATVDAFLQAVMFRVVTSLPPGKARFTLIDPIGLGQNFAAFMHLADFDEQLVTSRIWTEQHHIEQRLADLTAHMETVIQKYLRNQYATIAEFNEEAGEVAEPFRFLVVANFPANFTAEASRRLLSIATSGARCGVHVLLTHHPTLPAPQSIDVAELERAGTVLLWESDRFRWRDPAFGRFVLAVDDPPSSEQCTRLLHAVGTAAKEAGRVEVPFEYITPEDRDWWTQSSRFGLDVAIGRSGATRRQRLELGKGTAQHVLVAGKTGSGKSTLLHALVTNLALRYSPHEVELYLVDFKEGVEFKAYATHELPHARLIAIESEREFGLSVLQRLEEELKTRGDRFRAAGVQDIASYRERAGAVMPRILLVVDEFQLFFVEDDRIAQEAALLLDRLVRQGRAFGIHVLLGSQTLGGAYSLARSTIGQMAVRIALQCSEADAHLILSDDNPAARLLSRPGEAIYNDANGLVEGNDFFQVVWLPEARREDYLTRIRALAATRSYRPPYAQVVFEGNQPADIRKNPRLHETISLDHWPVAKPAVPIWLGDAVAIKDPTAAVFARHTGSNLLMIGQADGEARGMITAALTGIAAQLSPAGAQVYFLDGSPADDPLVDWFPRLLTRLPHRVTRGSWRETAAIVGEVSAIVECRQKAPESPAPAIFVIVFGLQRLRDLRRTDDDMGFGSRRGEARPPAPPKLLATILRDGPAVGVHCLIWCDHLTNVSRAFDRQTLREFEMKVLMQMSPADSSNLIDSPLASKLGVHRAYFHSEDRGQPEKFRPYGLPNADWLQWLEHCLENRPRSHADGSFVS